MAHKHVHIANRQDSMPNIAVDISQRYVHTMNKQVDISNMFTLFTWYGKHSSSHMRHACPHPTYEMCC